MSIIDCTATTNGTNCLVQGFHPCAACQQFLDNMNPPKETA